MPDESKKKVEDTTAQDDSTEEKKDQDQTGDDTSQEDNQQDVDQSETDSSEEQGDDNSDEDITISKKELATLKKKSEDFDAIIKSKRIDKLSKKKKDTKEDSDDSDVSDQDNEDTILKKAEEIAAKTVSDIMTSKNKVDFDKNLSEVYTGWLKDNPWADTDEITEKLSEHLIVTDSVEKEDILVSLDNAAMKAFPKSFKEALKTKARREVNAEESKIDVGDGTGSTSEAKTKTSKQFSKEDQKMADQFFNGDVERYLKYKN